MKVLFDSSAFGKRYINDESSDLVDQTLASADALGVSVLCYPEIISALSRRKRERHFTADEYIAMKTALEDDLQDVPAIPISDDILLHTVQLLETWPLRSADAIHIASAIVWGADLFVSADKQQCSAAEAAGLTVLFVP